MGLVDDLNRLSDLHASGQLSDEEFEDAKTRLIRESTGTYTPPEAPVGTGDTAAGPATSSPYDPTLSPPTPPSFSEVAAGTTGAVAGAAGAGGSAVAPPPPGSTSVHQAPSTVITSGLGTGGVSLGALPPTGRLRTRAQGLTSPGAVEPKRSAKGTFLASLGCLTIVIVFVALMVASAGVAMFPGLARLSAPFLCEAPFDHSYVDITSSNPVPGETYIEWELQCYNDRGAIDAQSQFTVMGIVFVETVVVLFALFFLIILIARILRRVKGGGGGPDQVQPVPPAGSLDDLSGGGPTAGFPAGGPVINPPS
ncbi:MAG: SHOCT domain-containing protein [Acidimicrobiales bacterium]|nr:SHOCT domain-containing protein [Acidimicrobiales bacterium]